MLRVEKLTYEVKGRKLVKDVSFQLRKGEVLALLGANGAGKSTLMTLLCGDKKPLSGTIYLNGRVLSAYAPRELSTCRAMLSQQQHITLAFKVYEIVMMGRYPHFKSAPSSHDAAVVNEVMKVCGVEDFAERDFLSLSGGEQQRVQLARVLAQIWDNPDSLLLLDEPISALDLHYQQKVLAIAKALSRRGMMVVMVVHDVNFAAMYADRILMLKHGRKLFDGNPVEVLNTKNIYTVFSVEAAVDLNTRTLKPYVRLEEMDVDEHTFNSMLPIAESMLPPERRRDLLLARFPNLPIDEQAKRLGISEVEVLLLDKSISCRIIISDFETLLPYLSRLGKIKVSGRAKGCVHTKVGIFDYVASSAKELGFAESDMEIRMLLENCYLGLMVSDEGERSLRFFDREGSEFHAIYLIDGESDTEVFGRIQQDFSVTKDRLPILCSKQSVCEQISQLDEQQQRDFRKQWEQLSDAKSFLSLLDNYGLSRLQALQIVSGQQSRRRDASFVQKTLSACAKSQLSVSVLLHNEGCVQAHHGTIVNLVDQGDRYMIKDTAFNLEIQWEAIRDVWAVSLPDQKEDIRSIELFGTDGHLVLQIWGEAIAQEHRIDSWGSVRNEERHVI